MALETKILNEADLDYAAALLRRGEVVAFPTETVYGLGANALNPAAVARIFEIKNRPRGNPLILHLAERGRLAGLVQEIPAQAALLMDKFWPGPLTLVLKKTDLVPSIVSAGGPSVGIRFPDHPLALRLLGKVPFPLAAPSANLSGRPSPTRAEHVLADLGGRIPAVLDGGETGWGLESTVVDCTVQPFQVLRPGGITLEELKSVVPVQFSAELGRESGKILRSPEMKQHYAPDARIFLVLGPGAAAKIKELSETYLKAGMTVGIMAWNERLRSFPDLLALPMGPEGDLVHLAAKLYHLLREADRLKIEVLFIEGVSEKELGLAVMNRLRNAADKIIQT